MVGFLILVGVILGMLWLAWRFSPRRRMIRNRLLGEVSPGEVSHGERTKEQINLALIEQRATNIRDSGGFGI